MKDTERRFFRYLIKQIDYENLGLYCGLTANLEVFLDHYSETKNVPEGLLWYYIKKWKKFGFVQYDTDLHAGKETTELSFVGLLPIPGPSNNELVLPDIEAISPYTFDIITCCNIHMYRNIIPKRVTEKVIKILTKNTDVKPLSLVKLTRNQDIMVGKANGFYVDYHKILYNNKYYLCDIDRDHYTYNHDYSVISTRNNITFPVLSVYNADDAKLPDIKDLYEFVKNTNFAAIPNSLMVHTQCRNVKAYCLNILNYNKDIPYRIRRQIYSNGILDSTIYLGLGKVNDKLFYTDIDEFVDMHATTFTKFAEDAYNYARWFISDSKRFDAIYNSDIESLDISQREIIFNDGRIAIAVSDDTDDKLLREFYQTHDTTKLLEHTTAIVVFKYQGKVKYYLGGNAGTLANTYCCYTNYIVKELLNK